MKKLILSAAIVLGSLTTFAQTAEKPVTKVETVNPVQEKYNEIKAEEVPQPVQTALKTAYPDATVAKAYVNEKKEYKLEITVGDQKATVYADADGNWLKK